jgi:nitrite reductase/ring-hydroxylating ferredoxin subunit
MAPEINRRGTRMVTSTGRLALCRAADVTDDMPLLCNSGSTAYAVFIVDGEYYVIDDHCSHGPGSLSQGYVDGYEIECPFHQGRFDIRTGCPTGTPCTEPVRTWPVLIVDGMVTVDPCEERLCEH